VETRRLVQSVSTIAALNCLHLPVDVKWDAYLFGLEAGDCTFIVRTPIGVGRRPPTANNKLDGGVLRADATTLIMQQPYRSFLICCLWRWCWGSKNFGLLGLPNSTTMQSRSFGNIEGELAFVIQSRMRTE
jgi:hypothetical protein